MDDIVLKLHKRFYCLPRNMILKIYKVRFERLRMLMRKGMPEDVRLIIKKKVQHEEYISFIHLPGTGRSTYARKRRAKRLGVLCHKCAN